MDIAEILVQVGEIKANADDPERAHGQEDDLHTAVLRAIADGHYQGSAAGLAKAALRTLDIEFPRWCA